MQARHRMQRMLVAGAISFMIAPATSARALPRAVPRVPVRDDPVCAVRVNVADRASSWAAPLDRIVTVKLPDEALRDALDHVAELAKVELSYSNELLPAGRRVCLSLDRVPVGAVLETLLAGTTLRPIVVGSTQVVIAPSRPAAPAMSSATPTSGATPIRSASVLDRVVVTGTPDGAPQRGSPFALEVIDGATLAQQRATSLGEALALAVPGVWMWSSSAGTLQARYGSIRGASSFGVSAPKVYLDGIEVANSLLVTQIDPARIERVEVIRGPQGAALYGAEAISGVVNILTRHDGTETGKTSLQLSSVAGMAATQYAPNSAFVQEHAVALRGGSSRRSFGLGLNLGTVGDYVPGASERRILADGDLRLVLKQAVLTGTGRLSLQKANASTGLMFGDVASAFVTSARDSLARANAIDGRARGTLAPPETHSPPPTTTRTFGDSATGQDVTQYTLGGTATVMPSLQWTHTLILGVDGYRLKGLSTAGLPMPSVDGGSLLDGQGGADRGTLRVRAVGRYDLTDRTMLSLTFAGEQAFTREMVDGQSLTPVARVNLGFGASAQALTRGATPAAIVTRYGNSGGLSAQANLAWHDQLYLVAGGRAERATGFTESPQDALLPMLGVAYVRDVSGAVVKLRSAYGTGIRPATSLARGATWMGRVTNTASSLEPESQTGIEAGVDVIAGHALSFSATRFDQRASGLIQPVGTAGMYATNTGALVRRMTYQLENVGAITNRGWELQARSTIDRLMLSATMTLVDSRVDELAPGYSGDLRVGDRMLDVPARTYSLSAAWTASRWSASTMLTRAEDWVGYDRVRVGEALQDQEGHEDQLNGRKLRSFWLNYDDVTRWRANVSYRLAGQWALLLGGENLLNVQRGAPDNATVTAGRTVTFGVRAGY